MKAVETGPPLMSICWIAFSPEAVCTSPEKLYLSSAKFECSPDASESHLRGQDGEDSEGQPGAPSAG